MCDDEPRFHPDHLVDNLDIPDDAGPNATARIIRDAGKRSVMQAQIEELRAMLSRSIAEGADREWPRTAQTYLDQPS